MDNQEALGREPVLSGRTYVLHCPYCEQVVSEQRTDGSETVVTMAATHSCSNGIYQLTAHMVLVA